MICSPCTKCPKKKMPKDVCMKNCQAIHEVQNFQIAKKEEIFSYSVDYIEESGLGVNCVEFV